MQTVKTVAVDVRDVGSMCNIRGPRKLEQEEHIKTRTLWEKVFEEDSKEFLDYYYSVKMIENEIYVMEDGGEIVSMLHLNPYQMRIGDSVYQTHYIVAVATDEKYRKRGYMTTLLNHTLNIMKDRNEPFTFLMPAAEAIYKPFGFEFIYTQSRVEIRGKNSKDDTLTITTAMRGECLEIADFANAFLKNYEIVTHRDALYYETLLKEYNSENGGILLARRHGKIVGVVCYAKSKSYECMEPLFHKETDLQHAIYSLTNNEEEFVVCTGYGNELTKPIIMAKILQPEFGDKVKNAKVFLNEVV